MLENCLCSPHTMHLHNLKALRGAMLSGPRVGHYGSTPRSMAAWTAAPLKHCQLSSPSLTCFRSVSARDSGY